MELKNFITPIEEITYNRKIHHKDTILSVGSCFSTEIGCKLQTLEFNITVNPFGTIFNPISIFALIEFCIAQNPINRSQIVIHDGLYYHYQWHSSIYGETEEDLVEKIVKIQEEIRRKLKLNNHLILTFGTAIIHEYQTEIISNCHKQSKDLFTRRFLSLEELITAFNRFQTILRRFNPNINIIVTTSPIRHTKEGLVDNNRSKALLNVFNQNIELNNEGIKYFPSFEILMDVLRDYRFYKPDLIHPNQQAIDEVWNYFQKHIIDQSSLTYIKKMQKYNQMKHHKIMFSNSKSGHNFKVKIKNLYKEIQLLK